MASAGFDALYYLNVNPDVQRAILDGSVSDAEQHFRLFGAVEGRNPNAAFNSADYLAQNSDVRAAVTLGQTFTSAWDHYIQYGAAEGRSPSTDTNGFDAKAYLALNPDVAAAGYTQATALAHYALFGIFENRQGVPLTGSVLAASGVGTAQDDRLIPAVGLNPSVMINASGQAAAGDTLVLTKDTAPGLAQIDLSRGTDQNLTGEAAGSPRGPALQGFENIDGSRALLDLSLTGVAWGDGRGSALTGGAGRDTLTGGAGADALSGNDGNDSLVGAAGADTLVGGIGNDTLSGGTGNDTLSDDGGDDQGFGDVGDDIIDLGAGRNRADGGDGNDTITANSGTETLTGGAGNDTFRLTTGALQSGDAIDGGTGQDALVLAVTGTDANSLTFDPSTTGGLRNLDALVLMDTTGTSVAKQFRLVLTDGFLAANGRSDGLIIDARGLPAASQVVLDLSRLTEASASLLSAGSVRLLVSPNVEVRDQNQTLITSNYNAAAANPKLPTVSAFTLISQTGITAGQSGAYNADRTILVPETVVTPPTPPAPPVVTPTAPAPTLALTTGLTDSLVPATAGTNDSFTGGVGTLNGTDVVNGNGGTDTLTLSAQAGATINTAGTATVTDIDTIALQTAAAATLNGTGFTTIGEVIVTGSGALTVVTPSANLASNTPFVLGTGYAQTLTDASGLLTSYALAGSTAGAGISTTRTTIALAVRAASTLTSLTTGAGTATLTGTGALTLGTVTGTTQIDGSAMTGALTHTATAATVRSGSANDTITLGVANSRVDTGSGNDTITGGANLTVADTILGGAGTDVMTLTARTANTDLDNVTGIETITFADGASYTYVISVGSAQAGDGTAVTFDASALTGSNLLSLTANNTTGHAVTVTGGAGNDSLAGGNLADSLSGGDGNDTLGGSIGNDTLIGGSGNDRLGGFDGNDSLVGEAGNDTLLGEGDNDTLDGGLGDDSLDGGIGNDSLIGGVGNDYIFGDGGNDELLAGDGNNGLEGGTGNDTLYAGTGNDNLDGGADNDTFTMANNLTSADMVIGGAGSDSLTVTARNADTDLDRVTGVETITLTDGASYQYVISAASGFATDTTTLTLYANGLTAGNRLTFDGSQVTGNAMTVYGGADADSIVGGAMVDGLNGGAGNDTLNSGGGNDFVRGGAGADSVAGGAGGDGFYVFRNESVARTAETITAASIGAGETLTFGNGVDVITDFVTSSDKVVVAALNSYTLLTVGSNGSSLTANNHYGLRGNFAAGVFTVNNSGADTLLIFDAVAGAIDDVAQTGVAILMGVTNFAVTDLLA